MSASAAAAAPADAPPSYGFPGHSVAASPVLSLWRQARGSRGSGRAATPAGAAVSPFAAMRLSPLPRDGSSPQRVHFQRFVFLACGSLGVAVFALAIAAQQVQDPKDTASYVARCSALYPQYAVRHGMPLNASAPFPPPRPPHPPRSPPPPLALPPLPPAKQQELYPGYSDFQRGGAQLCFASLIVGVAAFLIPLVCGSCCACDGRRCCSCAGSRALAALLCQALGWFGFGVFVANMAQAASWQASITCGCSPGRAGVSVPAAGVLGMTGVFGPPSSSSDSSSSSSSDYGLSNGCGGKPPAVLADLYITIFGALGLFACAMSLGYFYLSSLQAAVAARDAALRLMPLLPTARRQLPPIIVAEPWGAPRGGQGGERGAGEGAGGSELGVVEMMRAGRMVVVEEPGGTVCVGTTEAVQQPPATQQQQLAQAPTGAAQAATLAAGGEAQQPPPLPRGFRRIRPPPEPPAGV